MEEKNLDTQEKIKEAARTIFTKKGYAASRTRDIAQEAGINLSLLNYYFRSKEKLFNIIMMERMQQFFGSVMPIINDETLPLETKIERFADRHIDMLAKNPDLPIFILHEIRSNPKHFSQTIGVKHILANSSLLKQLRTKKPDVDPLHFILNLLAFSIFPFLAKPLLTASETVDEPRFDALVNERKQLVPLWLNTLLDAT